jgi:hypothetical protein
MFHVSVFESDDELGRMWKESAVTYFMVMAQTFYLGTEWYYKKPQVRWPHFLVSAAAFWIRRNCVTFGGFVCGHLVFSFVNIVSNEYRFFFLNLCGLKKSLLWFETSLSVMTCSYSFSDCLSICYSYVSELDMSILPILGYGHQCWYLIVCFLTFWTQMHGTESSVEKLIVFHLNKRFLCCV